mmetsp:Transcript_4691/g.8387  ORF Transcript_4691/g.8387 Transcript_4691/m.8387 type:complete len:98 (-) Transcript_4691:766-1059(-)
MANRLLLETTADNFEGLWIQPKSKPVTHEVHFLALSCEQVLDELEDDNGAIDKEAPFQRCGHQRNVNRIARHHLVHDGGKLGLTDTTCSVQVPSPLW